MKRQIWLLFLTWMLLSFAASAENAADFEPFLKEHYLDQGWSA
jgi:hypothetical protein